MSVPYPERGAAPPRERTEPREMAALAALAEAHPELAPAVALERELFDGERRLLRRIGTPSLAGSPADLAGRLAGGQRLAAWHELSLDWPEVRLRLRQVVDVLRRHDVLEPDEATRFQVLGRDGALVEAGARWYDAPEAGGEDALGDVLALTLRPFLTRTADVLLQRVSVDAWRRGTCPVCGASAAFGVIPSSGERQLVCARCQGRWPFDARTCPRCLVPDRLRVFAAMEGRYQVAACEECKRYVKALDVRKAGRPLFLPLDTVATLAIDQAVGEQGYTAD
ncbi:MAG: formate dehydrogenase accessory protein FdhE [Vicinamibacterales bacterium]